MAEPGIDISGEFPKPWTDEGVQAADVVITAGCADWVLDDPAGQDVASFRPIRDEIERQVIHLPDDALGILVVINGVSTSGKAALE
jgi:protein-tyrosine-phosphatase